jgi:hypothetical protein
VSVEVLPSRPPRTYEMVCLFLQGWAAEEEWLAHIAKLKSHTA